MYACITHCTHCTHNTIYTLTVWWKLLVSASCSAAPQMTGVNSNDRLREAFSEKKHCFL